MLGSTPLTAILGAAPDPTNHDAVRLFIGTACDAGLSLLLCYPGTKKPFDGRTVRKKNADDKAAQAEAKEAGRGNWAKVKSASGLALATTDKKLIVRKGGYLDEYIKYFGDDVAVNIAIEVGGSNLIVVDCDTLTQKEGFLETSGAPEEMPPTVVSPGTQGPDGTWIHEQNCGHYYFTLPKGVELPVNTGAMTWGGENGFAILWNQRYVLIPPSTRPEGPYELVGRDYEAPTWLIEAIEAHAEAKLSRYLDNNAERTDDLSTDIDAWAEQVSWADILEPLGWEMASRPDNCGCDIWTAPGTHSSPKSATAHDGGCALGRYTEVNAPLKIWTDNPGPPFDAYIAATKHTAISKLQAVAWSEHGGDVGRTMDALGLGAHADPLINEMGLDNNAMVEENADPTEEITLPDRESAPDDVDPIKDAVDELDNGPADDGGTEDYNPFADPDDEDDAPVSDIFETGVAGLPVIAPFSYWRNMPPPEYVVDGLLEHGGLSCIIGKPGVGKSAVALDMALCIGSGRPWQGRKTLRTRTLYLPGEGLSGAVQRMKAFGLMHDQSDEMLDEGTRLANDIVRVGASNEAWGLFAEYILRQRIGLLFFDTFARMATGIEENSATEVGKAIVRLDNIRRLTNCGVVLIHHTAKDREVGRGSSALNGALDSELLVRDATWDYESTDITPPAGKMIELITTKQKNAPQLDEPIPLLMRNCAQFSAPYITGPTGEVDPMLGDITLARPRPEPIVETAIRVNKFLRNFTETYPTKAEIVAGVKPDPYTRSRTDSAKAWKQTIALAIDVGMRYGLIEHPVNDNDTVLTAKFVVGGETHEGARTAHARAVLGDEDSDV